MKYFANVEGTVYTVDFEDNETAENIKRRSPLTLKLVGGNEFEKCATLPFILQCEKGKNHGKVKIGDLVLFGDKTLVLFCSSCVTKDSFVPIAHFDCGEGLDWRISKRKKVELNLSAVKDDQAKETTM